MASRTGAERQRRYIARLKARAANEAKLQAKVSALETKVAELKAAVSRRRKLKAAPC